MLQASGLEVWSPDSSISISISISITWELVSKANSQAPPSLLSQNLGVGRPSMLQQPFQGSVMPREAEHHWFRCFNALTLLRVASRRFTSEKMGWGGAEPSEVSCSQAPCLSHRLKPSKVADERLHHPQSLQVHWPRPPPEDPPPLRAPQAAACQAWHREESMAQGVSVGQGLTR